MTMNFGSHSCEEEKKISDLILNIYINCAKKMQTGFNKYLLKESRNLPKSCWQKASRTVFNAGASSTDGQFWQAGFGKSVI